MHVLKDIEIQRLASLIYYSIMKFQRANEKSLNNNSITLFYLLEQLEIIKSIKLNFLLIFIRFWRYYNKKMWYR